MTEIKGTTDKPVYRKYRSDKFNDLWYITYDEGHGENIACTGIRGKEVAEWVVSMFDNNPFAPGMKRGKR